MIRPELLVALGAVAASLFAPDAAAAADPAPPPVAQSPSVATDAGAPGGSPAPAASPSAEAAPVDAAKPVSAPQPASAAVGSEGAPPPATASDGSNADAEGEGGDIVDLESLLDSSVVSGASRTAEKADDAPATTTTVTADDLRRYGIRTLAEALNFLSLGMYSQDPLHAVEVGARGVLLSGDYGNHVLLVVDGNIMNEPWNGTAYYEQGSGIPIEMIDHIEVITGAGSVLYGSYAMLGVINVVTKSAKDSKGVHGILEVSGSPPVNSSGSAVFSTRGAGGTLRVGVNAAQPFQFAGKEGEASIGVDYYTQNGPTFEYAPQFTKADVVTDADGKEACREGAPNYGPNSYTPCVWGGRVTEAYRTQVPTLLARARWGEFSSFLKATQYTRNQPARDLFGASEGDFNSPVGFERDRTMIGELKWQKTITEQFAAMARFYGGLYSYNIDTYSHDFARDGGGQNAPTPGVAAEELFISRQRGASQWGGLELQATYDFTEDGRFPLLIGLDNRLRRIGSYADYIDVPTAKSYGTEGHYDSVEFLVAPYLQQRAKLSSEWQLNAGVRVDAQTDFAAAVSPRFAAVWSRPAVGIAKLIFSSAFRTPTGYERFTDIAGEHVPNKGLTPERVYTGEGTFERRFGKLRALGGLFFSRFSSMVAYEIAPGAGTPDNPAYWYVNNNAITNFGFNGLLEGSTDALKYGATLTVASTRVETEAGDRRLTVSPTYFGNVHAGYEFPKPFPLLSAAVAFMGRRYADVAYADGHDEAWRKGSMTPAHVEARLTAIGDLPFVDGLKYRVMVNNAFHRRAPYLNGVQGAPDAENEVTAPTLAPVNRFTVMIGAQYDWNAF